MVSEFFKEYGTDAAIQLTPEEGGRFEVYFDGEKIFDRKELDGIYPSLTNFREMKTLINSKLETVAADD